VEFTQKCNCVALKMTRGFQAFSEHQNNSEPFSTACVVWIFSERYISLLERCCTSGKTKPVLIYEIWGCDSDVAEDLSLLEYWTVLTNTACIKMIGAVWKLIIFTSMVNRIINTGGNERVTLQVFDICLQIFNVCTLYHTAHIKVLVQFLPYSD